MKKTESNTEDLLLKIINKSKINNPVIRDVLDSSICIQNQIIESGTPYMIILGK
jgi:hypothetical protein